MEAAAFAPPASPRPGTIVWVRMRNLMVHHDRTIELQPRLNFITGTHCSGKTAFLIAIRLALGWDASDVPSSGAGETIPEVILTSEMSGRGGLKSLVRKAADSDGVCVVELVLCNEGLGCLPQPV